MPNTIDLLDLPADRVLNQTTPNRILGDNAAAFLSSDAAGENS